MYVKNGMKYWYINGIQSFYRNKNSLINLLLIDKSFFFFTIESSVYITDKEMFFWWQDITKYNSNKHLCMYV